MTHPTTTQLAHNGSLAAHDLEAVLGQFLASIVELADAQAGAVRVLTDDGQSLRMVASLGLSGELVQAERVVDRHCGVCGLAGHTDVLSWVDDLSPCAQRAGAAFFGTQCRGMLVISLPYGPDILGVYNLFFADRQPVSPQVQTLLRLVGQLLGLTLHNARIERERLRMTVLQERQELVNEVHDTLAQTLAYARMRLPLLSDAIAQSDQALAQRYLDNLKSAVTEVHDNLREVMTYFRTRMDPLGLLHALDTLADSFQTKHGIHLEVINGAANLNLTDTQEVQVYYILQEALANIAKHSMARHAAVRINRLPHALCFLVEDDGLGLDDPTVSAIVTAARPLVPSTRMGLDIMRSRAHRLGGELEVGPNDGVGTRVRLTLPLAVSHQEATA